MLDMQQQLDALTARVAQLERERWSGPPCIGPRPETPEQEAERANRIAETIASAADAAYAKEVPPVDRTKLCTTDGRTPEEARASQTNETGQHASYIVLCEDERKRGFVRPYRDSYRHVGPSICAQALGGSLVCYMDPGHGGECGIAKGPIPQACRQTTTMGRALSETYARDPTFYGATFCCHCNMHRPVSEFVWIADGTVVGS